MKKEEKWKVGQEVYVVDTFHCRTQASRVSEVGTKYFYLEGFNSKFSKETGENIRVEWPTHFFQVYESKAHYLSKLEHDAKVQMVKLLAARYLSKVSPKDLATINDILAGYVEVK